MAENTYIAPLSWMTGLIPNKARYTNYQFTSFLYKIGRAMSSGSLTFAVNWAQQQLHSLDRGQRTY